MGAAPCVVKRARVLKIKDESPNFQSAPCVLKVVAMLRAAAIRGAAGVFDWRRD
jgi:hypothetical protein